MVRERSSEGGLASIDLPSAKGIVRGGERGVVVTKREPVFFFLGVVQSDWLAWPSLSISVGAEGEERAESAPPVSCFVEEGPKSGTLAATTTVMEPTLVSRRVFFLLHHWTHFLPVHDRSTF